MRYMSSNRIVHSTFLAKKTMQKSSGKGCANMALKDNQFALHSYQAYKITIYTVYGTQKQY